MLDEAHVDMLRADAALETAYATIEQLRRELAELEASAATQLRALELALPIVEKHEPCGYYCDEDHGHIDHPVAYAVHHAINEHPRGAALLAEIEQLRQELDAARRWAKTWKREAYVEWMAFQSANRAATVECEKAMKAEAELAAAQALIEGMRRTLKGNGYNAT